MSHLEEFKILCDIQHGFRKYHSCETQLLITLEDLARNLAINKWIQAWLCYREQSVLVEGEKSAPVTVLSGRKNGNGTPSLAACSRHSHQNMLPEYR